MVKMNLYENDKDITAKYKDEFVKWISCMVVFANVL